MDKKVDIGINKIKVSKGKSLLKFLDKHLCVVYLFVGIVLFLFSCQAKAEGLDQYYLDTLRPMFPDFTDEQWAIVESCSESCPYFIKLDSSNSNYRILILYPFSSQYVYDNSTGSGNTEPCYCVGGSSSTIGVGGFSLSPYSLGNVSGLASYAHYAFVDYLNSHEAHGMKYSPSRQYYDSSSSWNMRWFECSTSALVGSSVSVSFTYSRDSYLTNDYCVFQSNYTAFTKFEKNIEKPTYTEDSRLKFALINDTYDGEVLLTDIRQFMADFTIQDTSHSSAFLDPESITLKYAVDGIEKTITLDSNNSTIRSKYIFETPVYHFDFDDDNTSVIITSADFTIAGTSQSAPFVASETYRIATNYPIRRLSPLPILSPIPNPTYNDVTTDVSDPGTVLQEITTQLTNDSTTTNAFTGEWTLDQEHPTVPSWADNYDFRVIKSDFNSIISGIVNKDIWNYYTSNDPNDYDWITGGFNPRNFVDDNRNFAFYDMIVISVYEANIAWDPDNVGTNLIYQNIHLLGYITLYSQRYYVHKSTITDSNILATLEYSSMNDVAFYETIKATVDQFEEYTLGRLDASLDIEKDSLSWLKTIDNSIKAIDPFDDSSILGLLTNIYDAISGWGGTDTSNIETKLDTLINHFIANNSQENSSYKRFVTWLRDVNGKPVQYVTTGYDFFTELFDYFPFTKDLDGAGGFANVFDMGKGFIDLSTGNTTGIPEHYQSLSYYFNSANNGSYNVSSMSGR